jgi:hypothetical protein
MSNCLVAQNPDQEDNHMTPDRTQVPQVGPLVIGLHNSNQEQGRENGTDHMGDKKTEVDIKSEPNFMNIIAYRAR